MKTYKEKLSETGNLLISLKSQRSLGRKKRKNLPSSSPKSIASEKSGKKEGLENCVSLGTKLLAMSECWSERIKLISAS